MALAQWFKDTKARCLEDQGYNKCCRCVLLKTFHQTSALIPCARTLQKVLGSVDF